MRSFGCRASLLILPFLLGFGIPRASAQFDTASVVGTVKDSSGGTVPDAKVTLTNTETGVVLSATTNESGLYRFLFLNPGQYKLVATMAGFKTFERDGIRVNVSEAGTLFDRPTMPMRASRSMFGV